jgi:hypothetical protein
MLDLPYAATNDIPSFSGAWLLLDETAAVVVASRTDSQTLYERFRNRGLTCTLLPGHCGADLIDFGNPSTSDERLIRKVFASWRQDAGKHEGSLLWCVWIALLVVAVWLLSLLASW